MNNSQEIILAQISAIYDKPPFVKVKTGQMEMILKCVGLGKYYDEYAKYLEPYWYNRGFQNDIESYRIFVGLNSIFEDLLNAHEYMAKNGCRIGGEQSGHIIFSKYASTGDGILTSLKMMEVMLAKKKPMSELAAPLKIYPQVLENVRVTDKKAAQNDETVQAAVKNVAEALGDTGRILVRESGTEPVVRVMVEAPDHDTCQKYVSEVVDVIRDRGYSL